MKFTEPKILAENASTGVYAAGCSYLESWARCTCDNR